MIRIVCTRSEDSYNLSVKGHAGYAALGSDIVCAAVSMLVYTLIERTEELTKDVQLSIDKGDVSIMAAGDGVSLAFDTILSGFRLLAGQYPEHISLREG
ncbi:ribosomal-processing cysteine protease Prp [Lachnoclostridium sp. Marseille-P6806]|uniref:ribosomal-processing cysteine protease Prp n=1 Tax=Lachnoclostridium sp. Marseille-P6806 TaxID=2364793 RepID=UPI00102FFAFD|nr:ribosomal-processing cysteine protease Prp [Lachnoclostridium sp. Marseille-P6806]